MLKRIACLNQIPVDYIDDVVHDTFLSYAGCQYPMNLPFCRMKMLLMVILKSRCMDFHRSMKWGYHVELEEEKTEKNLIEKSPGPTDLIISKERCRAILQEIDRMPEKLRQVAVLKLIEGRSTREVCEILNITEKTCYSRVSRIRTYLREFLEDDNWP